MNSTHSRRFLYLGYYAFLSIGINASVVGPALPTFAAHSGAPLDQVGFLFTPLALGYATSVFIMGPIGARLGTRTMLIAGSSCLIASFVLLLLGRALGAVFLGAYLLGLGQSGTQVGFNATVGALAGNDAARMLNQLNLSFGIGALIGPLIVALGYSRFGSADIALLVALIGVMPLLAGAFAWREPGRRTTTTTTTTTSTSMRALLRRPVLWLLGVTVSVYVSSEVAFSGWAAVYTELSSGAAVAQSALVATAFYAGFVVGRMIAGAAGKVVRSSAIVTFAILLAAAGIGLMIAAGSLFAACVAGSFIVGCAMAPIYPIMISYGIRLFPQQATLVTGFLTSAAAVVTLFVPSAVGVVMVNQGTTAAWSIVLLIVALLGALWLALRRHVAALG